MTGRWHHHAGPWGAARVSLALGLPSPGSPRPQQVCASAATPHLFPIDVAGCYGDHGGFSHKPREEGAHAQGGSVYPGRKTKRPFVVNAELRHTASNPGPGGKAEGPARCAGGLHLRTVHLHAEVACGSGRSRLRLDWAPASRPRPSP